MTSKNKPTIIQLEKVNQKPSPTVIRSVDSASAKQPETGKISPSVIRTASANAPTVTSSNIVLQDESPTKEVSKVQPTKMAGFERDRLPVTMEEFRKANPEIPYNLSSKAYQMVIETDIAHILSSSALIWQTAIQKQYSDKVMLLLEHTEHESIAKASFLINRVTEILGAIDLHGVCEYEKDGMISKLLKHANKEYDTPEELHEAENELKQLCQLLSKHLQKLILLQQKLDTLNREIVTLATEVNAAQIAANFLADYLHKSKLSDAKIADQFLERSMSLLHTQTQIVENEAAREVQLMLPSQLITMIQNTVLVMLPDWLGSISSIRSMLESNKKVTITEVEEISDWKKRILKRLK